MSKTGASAKKMVTFVTGNRNKLREVQSILGSGIDMNNQALDLPELQGDPLDVAKEKCRMARKIIDGPVLVEDTSLCFNALMGLPGVYIKWFLEKIGHEGLNNLLLAYEDKSAFAQCIFAFQDEPDSEVYAFVGQTPGTIVPPRGCSAFGWDPIFLPDGFTETFGEMTAETKNSISHRQKALEKFKTFWTDRK